MKVIRFAGGPAVISLVLFMISGLQAQFENSIGIKMIPVKPGTFQMGTMDPQYKHSDEAPQHSVTISQPFFISETEVTITQFRYFRPDFAGSMTEGPYAVGLSWHDAVAFCQWLSEKEGRTYRLPTEAEWEYAAGAGQESDGPAVNESGPNAWGLKNVNAGPLEWCHDWYDFYRDEDQTDPVGPETGIMRVIRGGGLDKKTPEYARTQNRGCYGPEFAMMNGTVPESIKTPGDTSGLPDRSGLIGLWYGTTNWEEPQDVEILTSLEQDWSQFEKPEDNRETQWSAIWEGWIEGPADAAVRFSVAADNLLSLEVDGRIIGNKSRMDMKQGKKYPVRISYVHNRGEKSFMNIQWDWTGGVFTAIPAHNLFHSPAQSVAKQKQRPRSYLPGHHSIGFRIVQADWPVTKPYPENKPFLRDCVVQHPSMTSAGPDSDKPWYRRRNLIPIPPTDVPGRQSWLAGLPMGFGPHIHNSAMEICPNGDLLVTLYTAPMGPRGEDQPEVQLLGSRLRYGTTEWDMPDFFQFNSDVKLGSVCFSRVGDQIWFLDGHSGYDRHYPFQWMTSDDNGATWSTPHFPQITGDIGPYDPHPKNQILFDNRGNIYLPSDGKVSSSLLWISHDKGRTWRDTGGRTLGRHSVFQFLNDGRILGMGGKSADIDGYMPQNISADSGRTWQISKSVFAALGGNQRPCLIRLQSGKLFMCGDFQTRSGKYPPAQKQHGSYVALSADEGETWIIRELPGTLPHFKDNLYPTIGYSIARQAENGVIHIIATSTLPLVHYEINEAWIQEENSDWTLIDKPRVMEVQEIRENYPSGALKAVRRGGICSDGRYLLQGKQEWFYEDGGKKWEVSYVAGRKAGGETFWYPDGSVKFEWQHNTDGSHIWFQYWPNGQKKAESRWRNDRAEGTAQRWDQNGRLIGSAEFYNGRIYQTEHP